MLINMKLLKLAAYSKKWIILTMFCSIAGLLLNTAVVLSAASLIEILFSGISDMREVISTAAIMFTAAVAKCFLVFLGSCFSFLSSSGIKQYLREAVYKKLLELELIYKENQGAASVTAAAAEGIEALEVYYGRYLPQLFYSLAAPFILFAVLMHHHFTSALVLLLCVPLIPLSIMMVMKLAKKLMGQFWKTYEGLGEYFLESLQGLLTLKLFGRDQDRADQFSRNAWEFRKITMRVLGMQLNSITVMDTVAFAGTASGILTAAYAMSKGEIGIASAVAVLLLAPEFFVPLRLLGSYFHAAMNGVAASDRIFKLLDTKATNKALFSRKTEIDRLNMELTFENVCFSYNEEREIIKDVSFTIKPGSIFALVGESGCGKSTVAALMLAFLQPDSGRILLSGMDAAGISSQELRKHITLVTGNAVIFTGTIKDNLRMGNPEATDGEMLNVCMTAGLYDFINQLPQGLDTMVGERGSMISGGQRQRLALARALLHGANFIIFDEATSNVDPDSETTIWNAIYSLKKSKTLFIISHRLSTVQAADCILVMKEGRIVEAGKHLELMKRRGVYHTLVEAQRQLEAFGEGRVQHG